MKEKYLLEISVESAGTAAAAVRGGADRLELCANMRAGGVTPTADLMRATRALVSIPIFSMVRPRHGNFVFSASEVDQMKREIDAAKSCAVDGIVLGILRGDSTVDIDRTHALIEFARPLPVTFHRAFDETPDLTRALQDVVRTGATRILTSGGKPSAAEGTAVVASLVKAAADRITILPSGGINPFNLETVLRLTQATEFHSGLGSSLPYGCSPQKEFEREVRKLAEILRRMEAAQESAKSPPCSAMPFTSDG
jgi:copper homeostasis protein